MPSSRQKSMKVLHIGKYFPPSPGGIENFSGDLLPALTRIGITTAALVHQDKSQSSKNIQTPEIEEIVRAPSYGRFIYAPVSPAFPWFMNRLIKKFRPDIIHFHMPNTSAFWALMLPAAKTKPWVIHWHADVVSSTLERKLSFAYRFYQPFEQALLARAKAIICTSQPYMESSLALRKWQKKCFVIPLALNPSRLSSLLQKTTHCPTSLPRKTNSIFNVLAIGRLTYYKGHEVLIKAAASTKNINIFIIGKGEQRIRLENLIQKLKLEDRVFLLGYQSDPQMHHLMQKADCICLPSLERTEAFGLVLLEGMHHSKPIIASNIPGSGIGWVIQQNKTGILCPPGQSQALADALQSLANNPERARTMGEKGRERFNQCFHINNIAAKIQKIYCQVV